MQRDFKQTVAHHVRGAMRYPWAATLIPVGFILGVGGLVQHAVKTALGTATRSGDNT